MKMRLNATKMNFEWYRKELLLWTTTVTLYNNFKLKKKGTFHETKRVVKYNLDVFQTYWPNVYTFWENLQKRLYKLEIYWPKIFLKVCINNFNNAL